MRRLTVLLVAVALVLLLPTPASAAALDINDVLRPFTTVAERCDDAVTVTGSGSAASSVSVSEIDPACAGRHLTVRVYRDSPVPSSPLVTVPSSGAMSVTVPEFTPSVEHRAFVMIGGWPVPATWEYVPPAGSICTVIRADGSPRAGASCAVSSIVASNVQDVWDNNRIVTRRADVTVTFTQRGWVNGDRARLELDMTASESFPTGWTHDRSAPFSWSNFAFVSSCAELPRLVADTTYWVDDGSNSGTFGYVEDRMAIPATDRDCAP